MKLQDLFEMCDNLGYGSCVVIRDAEMNYLDEGLYPDMFAYYGDREIVSFKIDDERHATVYLAGLGK